jgi:hypothetical protein
MTTDEEQFRYENEAMIDMAYDAHMQEQAEQAEQAKLNDGQDSSKP